MFAPGLLSKSSMAADSCLLPPGTLPFPGRPVGIPQPDLAPELANIDHIFLVMMENKSFDAYMGMLPYDRVTAPRLARRVDGFRTLEGGRPTDTMQAADGKWYRSFRNNVSCATSTPNVSWHNSHESYNGGAMDGFCKVDSGARAMGFWDSEVLSTYYSLAAHFPVGDRYFSSTLASTDPNRLFSICGSAVGITDTMRPSPGNPTNLTQVTPPNGHIFEMLDHYGIGWATFCGSVPTCGLISGYAESHAQNIHIGGGNDGAALLLEAAIASGVLPPVVTIEPEFLAQSEENPGDIDAGQNFVYRAITSIMSNHDLWMRSLIVYCYDESGGYYDHVTPPPAPPPGDGTHPNLPPSQWYGDDYARYGFRVPNMVISPWARADHVSHVVRDHGSLLRTIETKWNLPALTARDANAIDFRECLVRSGPPPFAKPPTVASCPDPSVLEDALCNQGQAATDPPPAPVPAPARLTRPEVLADAELPQACAPARPGRVEAASLGSLPFTGTDPGLGALALVAGVAGLGALLSGRGRLRDRQAAGDGCAARDAGSDAEGSAQG
ncbi:MAG TPA: alkaline phosphatase family protein [Candidatus Solibacter sp.]|jgi:phospholipase C|nr:alkaline phosphatase family protein [Candidatus Solibacter sp.]